MQLTPKQEESVLDAFRRLNVWCGSVRSGKTIGSIIRLLEVLACPPPGGHIVIVGKTERTIKQNVIAPIEGLVGRSRVKFGQDGQVRICGVVCLMVGANDARAEGKIRGGTFAVAYVDEIVLIPEGFFRMLLSRLSVAGATFLGTTNPDSPFHWFKRDFIDKADLDLALFHFVIDDNPTLPPEYVASLKKEYTGLWYRRFILGEWCQAEGAVYADQWDEGRCTFTGFTQQLEWWAACDYGTTNPTTFGLYSRDRAGNVWCWSEYWWDSRATKRQKSDEEYVTDYLEWINTSAREVAEDAAGSGFPAPSCRPGHVRLDPSAASLKVAFEKRGIRVDAANNDVLEGIKHVGGLLQRGAFRIHKRCKESIREMGSYVWDPKAQARGEDAPVKTDDHTQDRHRYAIYNPSFAPTEATSAHVRI